jgi:hypothetical protein
LAWLEIDSVEPALRGSTPPKAALDVVTGRSAAVAVVPTIRLGVRDRLKKGLF